MAYLDSFVVVNGATNPDISSSVQSFKIRVGVQYKFDGISFTLVSPVTDTAGNTYTIGTGGDIDYGTKISVKIYGVGGILSRVWIFNARLSNVTNVGNMIECTADSAFADIFSAQHSETFNHQRKGPLITSVVEDYLIGADTLFTYGSDWNTIYIEGATYTNIPILNIINRTHEIFSVATGYQHYSMCEYYTAPNYDSYFRSLRYGEAHAQTGSVLANVTLSYDNGLISVPKWVDASTRVINDITVVYSGGSVSATDATSISVYGHRATTLYRPEYNNATDAQAVADAMIFTFKDPGESCTVDVDFDVLNDFITDASTTAMIGTNWTIYDGITEKTETMPLKYLEINYPSFICTATFDDISYNVDAPGISTDNRIVTLENNQITRHGEFSDLQGGQSGQYYHLNQAAYDNLYQQDQAVKTSSSPMFAAVNCGAITSSGSISTAGELRITTDNAGVIKARDILQFKDIDSSGEAQYIDLICGGLNIYATTQHTTASLALNRGADNTGWRTDIWFNPYGTVSLSNPRFRIGTTNISVNDHDLHFQHHDGTSYVTMMRLKADKSMEINANVTGMGTLGCGAITSSGTVQGASLAASTGGINIGGSALSDASRNITCNNLTVAGTTTGITAITPGLTAFNATASANTRNSFDGTSSFLPGASYVKRKTITFTNGLGPGTYRVYFEAAVQIGGEVVYAKIYKNGTAIGTERTNSSTAYAGWSQDFSGPLNPGDTIELWAYLSGEVGHYGYVRYFRIQYDLSMPTAMPATNS